MANYTEDLNNMLTEFVAAELGVKSTYGITYEMFLKNSKRDMDLFERYSTIRKEANKCGYSTEQIIRIYELINGYIIDLDINVVKNIIKNIWHFANKSNTNQIDPSIFVGDKPEQRRKKDMSLLAKNCKKKFDSGIYEYIIALFNKNSSNRIVFNANSNDNKHVVCAYDAFALRHWDIERLNSDYLIPAGFRVSRVQPFEILPTKTGVSFSLIMESMEKYYNMV